MYHNFVSQRICETAEQINPSPCSFNYTQIQQHIFFVYLRIIHRLYRENTKAPEIQSWNKTKYLAINSVIFSAFLLDGGQYRDRQSHGEFGRKTQALFLHIPLFQKKEGETSEMTSWFILHLKEKEGLPAGSAIIRIQKTLLYLNRLTHSGAHSNSLTQ